MAFNSIMEYGSSSCDHIRRYDVFVSFRGDTFNNFTGHLLGTLLIKDIHFFSYENNIHEHTLPERLQAIHESQILVVVFSKNYASSKWRLRELEKIATCINVEEKHVLPIFYDVTPSEVRNQSGDYKEAFDKYQKRFKEDEEKMEEVQRWRQALSQVANLSGWDIGNRPQIKEIENFVQYIQKLLPTKNVESEEWRRMSISWLIQIVKVYHHEGYPCFHRIGSFIPANEIPRWFTNRHVGIGNTISADATLLRQDDIDWIGVVFCVVFCISDNENNSENLDLVTDKSDHLYLFYFPRSHFFNLRRFGGTINSDKMMIDLETLYPDWDIKVKKYGYRWVYESHLLL